MKLVVHAFSVAHLDTINRIIWLAYYVIQFGAWPCGMYEADAYQTYIAYIINKLQTKLQTSQ